MALRGRDVEFLRHRHTTAGLAIWAGVNVLALASTLGHTSATVTLDVDADLFDDDLDAVALTLDQQCSRASVGKEWQKQ